jgi:ABC-2 type transport system ATP-binding protein
VVVFLDEPTLGLDPAGQRQVLAIVCSLAERREATVLLSTHALGVVEEVCTSVVILDRGRVVTAGSVAEVTRSVVPGRSARLRMPQDRVDAALVAMADRPDTLALRRADGAGGLNAALQAVIGAGVPVLSFELDGGRLSDAFLSITTTRGS